MTSPIQKVLSSISSHRVRCLLIGGQASILYGGAEFSRNVDIVILTSPENLQRLEKALAELQATSKAVPPFDAEYLRRGHAVHFRCAHPDAAGMRIDVISVMRGVDAFEEIWSRRTTVEVALAHPAVACNLAERRPFLSSIAVMDDGAIESALEAEEKREREIDREYWKPLREELERLRPAQGSA